MVELEGIIIRKCDAEELLMKWQTANLVLQGVFTSGTQKKITDEL